MSLILPAYLLLHITTLRLNQRFLKPPLHSLSYELLQGHGLQQGKEQDSK